MAQARGTFTVQLRPVEGEPEGLGRFELDKVFVGELAGTSRGVMLSAGDPATGSAGYVVIEVVDAQIGGHTGRFALQHSGTMHGGAPDLTITVVPGSGSGDFAGMEGTFTLDVVDGSHHYLLDYSLA